MLFSPALELLESRLAPATAFWWVGQRSDRELDRRTKLAAQSEWPRCCGAWAQGDINFSTDLRSGTGPTQTKSDHRRARCQRKVGSPVAAGHKPDFHDRLHGNDHAGRDVTVTVATSVGRRFTGPFTLLWIRTSRAPGRRDSRRNGTATACSTTGSLSMSG